MAPPEFQKKLQLNMLLVEKYLENKQNLLWNLIKCEMMLIVLLTLQKQTNK